MEAGWEEIDRRQSGGVNVRLLDEFLEDEAECIAKDMGDKRKATSKRNSLMQTIKEHERFGCIRASKRGTKVFLMKKREE